MLLRKSSAIIIDHHKGCEIYVVLHDYYNYLVYLISYKPLMHVVAYYKFYKFIYLFICYSIYDNDIVYGYSI